MQTNSPFYIAFHFERPIDASAVRALYDLAEWWPNRQPAAIAQVLNHDLAIGVWDQEQLIAFARAVMDGSFRAYIEDLVVHPAYRRQGIAVAMLGRLLGALTHIETISLFCTADLLGLYEQLGFKAHRSQVVMHRAGEELLIRSNGQDWITSWHPAPMAPIGTPHGAAGICVTDSGKIVLISNDGIHWDLPAGRPEADETWEQTLWREMLEEACATVIDARLLGFCRGACVAGPEAGLVLVRSFWRARVVLGAWEPQFEISHRRLVPATEVLSHLPSPFLPIFRRALTEAGLL